MAKLFSVNNLYRFSRWFERQGKKSKITRRPCLESLEKREVPAVWVSEGTGAAINGQLAVTPSTDSSGNIYNNQVNGAIRTILTHPNNTNIAWVGTVNGGIWKTTNARVAGNFPNWVSTTDHLPSLSIGALEFDRGDSTLNTLIAGIGRYSSFRLEGGERFGLLKSFDQGNSWSIIDGGGALRGLNISGAYGFGNIMMAAVDGSDSNSPANVGLWRSTNNGATFTNVTAQAFGNGGKIFQMISVVGQNGVEVYAAFASPGDTGASGIWRSTNNGGAWTKISDGTIDGLIANQNTNNIRIAANGTIRDNGAFYVGVCQDGQLVGGTFNNFPQGVVFRRNPADGVWTASDPITLTGGPGNGLQPRARAGGQGAIHFSMAADPFSNFRVYIGGDRIPSGGTGNLYRIDFTTPVPPGPPAGNANRVQVQRIMGNNGLIFDNAVPPTYTHTIGANGTTPHADSRSLVFDASGTRMLEGGDGGLVFIDRPGDTFFARIGSWGSLNGNLKVFESHSVAFDSLPVLRTYLIGNQDNGTGFENNQGVMDTRILGDGGRVASVVDINTGTSIRYASAQNLGFFRRFEYSAANTLISQTSPSMFVIQDGQDVFSSDTFPFVAPIAVNNFDSTRLLVGSDVHLYESFDRGETLNRLDSITDPIGTVNALAYGGQIKFSNTPGTPPQFPDVLAPDVLYVSAYDDTDLDGFNDTERLYVRPTINDQLSPINNLPASFNPQSDTILDISLDPNDWRHAVITTSSAIYETKTAGFVDDWVNLTTPVISTAFPANTGGFRTVEITPIDPNTTFGNYAIFVGGAGGAYALDSRKPGQWMKVGPYLEDNSPATPTFGTRPGLPNVIVSQFDYNLAKDVLSIGSLGRGAWSAPSVSTAYFDDKPPVKLGTGTGVRLPSVPDNSLNPAGDSVYNLFSGNVAPFTNPRYSDPDGDQFAGIAIVGNTSIYIPTTGRWQYSTNSGNTWFEVPTGTNISDQAAIVLRQSDKLRFLPKAGQVGIPGNLTVRYWDGKFGDYTVYDATSNPGLAQKDIRNLVGFSFSNDSNDVELDITVTTFFLSVKSATALANTPNTVRGVRVTFNIPALVTTFTNADATITSPSAQPIPFIITPVNPTGSGTTQSATIFDLTFMNQTAPGAYTLRMGPKIVGGPLFTEMDQNNNNIPGENPGDVFTFLHTLTGANSGSYANTIPANIPDNGKIVSAIFIPDSIRISDVNVTLNVTHPWVSDMVISLRSPAGQNITLFNRRGGSGDNLVRTIFDDEAALSIVSGSAPFSNSYKPEIPLSRFDNSNAQGTWYLTIEDRKPGDVGRLNSWNLNIIGNSTPSTSTSLAGAMAAAASSPGGSSSGSSGGSSPSAPTVPPSTRSGPRSSAAFLNSAQSAASPPVTTPGGNLGSPMNSGMPLTLGTSPALATTTRVVSPAIVFTNPPAQLQNPSNSGTPSAPINSGSETSGPPSDNSSDTLLAGSRGNLSTPLSDEGGPLNTSRLNQAVSDMLFGGF